MTSPLDDFTFSLTPEETDELIPLLTEQVTADPSAFPDLFCQQCKDASPSLPLRLLSSLQQFRQSGSRSGYFLVNTFLIQNDREKDGSLVPRTPSYSRQKLGQTTLMAKMQGLIMQSIGELVAYESEGKGNLFQDIMPVTTMIRSQTSSGSNTELEIHTEQAFSDWRPDFFSLACLRGDYQTHDTQSSRP